MQNLPRTKFGLNRFFLERAKRTLDIQILKFMPVGIKRKKRLIADPDSQLAAAALYDTVCRYGIRGQWQRVDTTSKITLVFLSRNRVKDL